MEIAHKSEMEFSNYEHLILAAIDGKTVYVRVPHLYPHRQELLRDRAYYEVRALIESSELEPAILKFSKNDIQFRSGGRILFVIDRWESRHWMEQDWARGVSWDGGLIAYWPEDKACHGR